VAKHDEPTMAIALKTGTRSAWLPDYHGPNLLTILRVSKKVHADAVEIVYRFPAFQFPGTQVVADFLMRIGSNRKYLRSLRSERYASQSARTMFHLLFEVPHLERLSFAHVSLATRMRRRQSRTSGTMPEIGSHPLTAPTPSKGLKYWFLTRVPSTCGRKIAR
jgi:hypothetical protein